MADIDIERKRGAGTGSPWPWIIGLVVLALVAWGIWEWMRTDEQPVAVEAPMEMPATEPVTPAPTPMMGMSGQRLQMWARDSIPQMPAGTEMQIVQQGMDRVTSALDQLSRHGAMTQPGQTQPGQTQPGTQGNGELSQRIQQLRQQTQQVAGLDATTPQASNQTRQLFMQAVQALEEVARMPHMQGANLSSEIGSARSAAESVDANQPLTQQRQALQRYFESMGTAIARAEGHMGMGTGTQPGRMQPGQMQPGQMQPGQTQPGQTQPPRTGM